MSAPILKLGATGPAVRKLQRELRARDRVADAAALAVDGILGPATWRVWRDTFEALGGLTFEGSAAAARRRYVIVVTPTARTPAELGRARRWRKAHAPVAGKAPKIIDLDLQVANLFGPLGAYVETVGHYTGGPRDTSDSHGAALLRSYHHAHAAKGWGGIGYHYAILRSGTILLLRPTSLKGCHVALHNTGRLGIVMPGTTGDRPTPAQVASYRWLLANAHTAALPSAHRAPVRLADRRVVGHNDLNATDCPGAFKPMYTSKGARSS
jgi:hypothetical protein